MYGAHPSLSNALFIFMVPFNLPLLVGAQKLVLCREENLRKKLYIFICMIAVVNMKDTANGI